MGEVGQGEPVDCVDVAFATAGARPDRHRRMRALAIVKAQLLGHDADKIGRYEIRGVLGRGGMGTVYRAWDPQLRRTVALKVVGGCEDSDVLRQRWLREGRALATVSDPHVVSVLDAGIVDDGVYLAMAHVPGMTLRRWLSTTPRTPSKILDVLRQTTLGLMAAHRQGIVHRDLKPENILVDAVGHAVLVDFGLARPAMVGATGDDGESTSSGRPGPHTAASGTPGYAAPEQVQGHAAQAASDQFGLCVTVHEALTGWRPTPEDRLDGRVPRRLRRCLTRGLSAEPGARWPDLTQILEQLRPSRTRRSLAVRLGGGAALAATLVVGGLTAAQLLQRRPEAADPARDVAPQLDPAVAGVLAQAQRAYDEGRFADTEQTLGTLTLSALSEAERGPVLVLRARCAADQRRVDDALEDARAAVLAASGVQDLRTELQAQLVIAFVGVKGDDAVDAMQALRRAAAIVERLGNAPRDRLLVHRTRASVHVSSGDYAAAAVEIKAAIVLDEAAPERSTGRLWLTLGTAQRRLGQPEDSLASHDRALERMAGSLGAHHPDIARAQVSRATVLQQLGRYDEALPQFAEAIARLEAQFGAEHRELAVPLLNYGLALRESGALADAIAIHERYRQIVAEHFDPSDRAHVTAATTLAEGRLLVKDWDGALRAATEATVLAERLLGAHHSTANAHDLAGQAMGAAGDLQGARRKSEQALTIAEAALGADHPGLIHYVLVASEAARKLNDVAQARTLLQRAEALALETSLRPGVQAFLDEVRRALGDAP